MKKVSTRWIKEQIPIWLTDVEAERLRSEFIPVIPFVEFVKQARDSKNWKRELKGRPINFNVSKEKGIERMFDCRPFESQLRLYVLTNLADDRVEGILFQTE